jgi:hypothetical protein
MPKKFNHFFSNLADRETIVRESLLDKLKDKPFFVVWVGQNALPQNPDFGFQQGVEMARTLIILEGRPVSPKCIEAWRKWARGRVVKDFKMAFIESGASRQAIADLLREHCADWLRPLQSRETAKIRTGEWVSLPKDTKKHDPALLTMMFGSMGELLGRMDLISQRFCASCSISDEARNTYLTQIKKQLLGDAKAGASGSPPKASIEALPRILLLGETGVGKTLFARYLADTASITRISIPEYLSKEDMFEYDLFGYARGAYTGGQETGSLGLLLANLGGVIFLDEIGEASGAIQAKLLAYLDDYMVRPRGWTEDPFFCPTLVVAATNRDLRKVKDFRPDLLARFTDIEQVPPLRERVESFPFILDCLLQNAAINPGRSVEEIGQMAYETLLTHPFKGNFRELETVLRGACHTAAKDGREFICRQDIPI